MGAAAQDQQLERLGLFVRRRFLSRAECARLRRDIAAGTRPSLIRDRAGRKRVDADYRRSSSATRRTAAMRRAQAKAFSLKPDLERHFGIALDPEELVQFLMYRPGDFFKPHRDRATRGRLARRRRRVTVVVSLSGSGRADSPMTLYELLGKGRLSRLGLSPSGAEGSLVAFPSALLHEVLPAPRARYTLVAWFGRPRRRPRAG